MAPRDAASASKAFVVALAGPACNRIFIGALTGGLVFGGCRRAPEPQSLAREPTPAVSSSATSAAPPREPVAATPSAGPSAKQRAAWTDPAAWTRVPSTSPMRLATYRV